MAYHLFDLTNGHPLLVQLYGQRLISDHQLRWPSEADFAYLFSQVAPTGIFDMDFEYLTENERIILRNVLRSGKCQTQ